MKKSLILLSIFCLITALVALLVVGLGRLEASHGVYWTDIVTLKIQRANLDGSNVEDLLTVGLGPLGIDLDPVEGKIYWSDGGITDAIIKRSNLDGTGVQVLVTGVPDPKGIDLDLVEGKIYWSEQGTHTIQRANLDGTEVEEVVDTGDGLLTDIAVDPVGEKVYWLGNGEVKRSNLDGSTIEVLVVIGTGGLGGIDLDLEAGKIYWTNSGALPRNISRANLDGTEVEGIVQTTSTFFFQPHGIALDVEGGKMYWSDGGINARILRSNLDGSDVEDPVTGLTRPYAIAVLAELTPEEEIDEILEFFDESVENETLEGVGPGRSSADSRLNALRSMIEEAKDLIEAGLIADACEQLMAAYKKTDGDPIPPDFVTGDAAEELAELILHLMNNLGC